MVKGEAATESHLVKLANVDRHGTTHHWHRRRLTKIAIEANAAQEKKVLNNSKTTRVRHVQRRSSNFKWKQNPVDDDNTNRRERERERSKLLNSPMRADSASTLKRRRLTTIDPMDSESAKAKLEAAKQKCGREIRVFETSPASPMPNDVSGGEEPDDFYEFTAEDYYRTLPNRKEDKFLKTRKIREAEEAARRSKITKAVMKVQFPDNCTLEGTFHPSETIQSLIDLLKKVIAQPELPFYIYTTPPKKQVKDMSLDFYSAGFVPGAIVYFSYDQLPQGDDCPAVSGPFLQEDILSLKGLELIPEKEEPVEAVPEPVIANSSSAVPERKPTGKKPVKPKWLKL